MTEILPNGARKITNITQDPDGKQFGFSYSIHGDPYERFFPSLKI